ncbi:MAG: hypothetical protein LBH78_03405 [Rickettsiales bacterium]|jgi:hypothetical protein|nr:hypothetical protein [Rickettsiales bacterium]
MVKAKDRIKKIRDTLYRLLVLLIPVVITFVFLWIVSSFFLSYQGETSKNILSLKTNADKLILGLMLLSVIVTSVIAIYKLRKKSLDNFGSINIISGIFNIELLILSIIPFTVFGLAINSKNIQKVVINTKMFYCSALVLFGLGVLVLIYLLRERLKQNNWWLFIIFAPHILLGWILKRDYGGFDDFIHSDSFSFSKVSEMLHHTELDGLMLNQSWFKCMAGMIIVLVVVIGLGIYEIIYKKIRIKNKNT